MSQPYGPSEGWLLAFLYASDPKLMLSTPLRRGLEPWEHGRQAHRYSAAHEFACAEEQIRSDDAFEESALRYLSELFIVQYSTLSYGDSRSSVQYQGADPDLVDEICEYRADLQRRISVLRDDIARFLERHEWSDSDEYLCSRIDNITRVLNYLPHVKTSNRSNKMD